MLKLRNLRYRCRLWLLIAIVELFRPEAGISVQGESEIWLLVLWVEPVCLSWLSSIVVVGFAESWCGTAGVVEDPEELLLCSKIFGLMICVICAANASTDPYDIEGYNPLSLETDNIRTR